MTLKGFIMDLQCVRNLAWKQNTRHKEQTFTLVKRGEDGNRNMI